MALKDPRIPKSNFRLRQIGRLMGYSWSAYRGTKVHAEKREYLTNLRNHLDDWLAEPEFIYDLAKEPAKGIQRECWSRLSPPEASFPFDQGGEATDTFFYFSYCSTSETFTEAQLELDGVRSCPYGRCGYFVTLLEKIYATENETKAHFFDDGAFDRHVKRASAKPRHNKGLYVVLADPAGHREGHTRQVCTNRNQDKAREIAEQLAEKFDVRFLVGQTVSCMDMH